MSPDLLDVLLSRADPQIAPQLAPLVAELRREYGGDTVYVKQRQQGSPPGEARMTVHRVTRRTLQRRNAKRPVR